MDSTEVFIAIIIPLLVSISAWMLTYIVPFIIPRHLSDLLLLFFRFQNPSDPSEIRIYINQFLNYNDWKILTAKGMLLRIFEGKLEKFEKEEKKYWNRFQGTIEKIPLKNAIKNIEDTLNESSQTDMDPVQSRLRNYTRTQLNRWLKLYQTYSEKNPNATLWHFIEFKRKDLEFIFDIDPTPRPEGYSPAIKGKIPNTYEELKKKLSYLFLIESNGQWLNSDRSREASEENFLKEVGLEKPGYSNEKERSNIFNKILLNLNLNEEENKKVLSIALSDMEESMEIFKNIIKNCSDITPLKTRFLDKLKNMELKNIEK